MYFAELSNLEKCPQKDAKHHGKKKRNETNCGSYKRQNRLLFQGLYIL